MNNLYHKINLNLGQLNLNFIKGEKTVSYSRLSYFKIKNLEYLQNKLPKNFFKIKPNYVLYAEIAGAGHLNAHKDIGSICGLNYYIESNNSTTYFYKPKNNSKPWTIPGELYPRIYDFDSLYEIDNFQAKSNECYLLNIGEIHSVQSNNNNIRKFITWHWNDIPFEQVLKSLS